MAFGLICKNFLAKLKPINPQTPVTNIFMVYCFLLVVTQVLYTESPSALVAVGTPNMLLGISTTMDMVLAPSKVSAASPTGKNPLGAEPNSGEITALN